VNVQVRVTEKAGSKPAVPEARVREIVGDRVNVRKFLENFEAMAEAEGGLKRLRELAIELAVRGLLLEGADPSSWKRVLLSDVAADFQNGISKRTGDAGRAIPVLRLADIDRGSRIRGEGLREIALTTNEEEKYRVVRGDILVIRVNGSADLVGRFVPCDVSRQWAYSDHLIRVRLHANLVDTGFLCSVARSAASRAHVVANTVTTAGQRTINQVGLGSLPLLLPSLEEQKRIVARVDQLMDLIDDLEARQTKKREVSARFTKASLEALTTAEGPEEFDAAWKRVVENFPTVIDRAEKVTELRRAVFGLACRGALTKRGDGSGEEVVRLIAQRSQESSHRESHHGNRETARHRRKLADQQESSGELSLPANWAWASLLACSRHLVDCHNKTAPYTTDGVPLVRTSNIRDGKINLEGVRYVSEETYRRWSQRCPPEPGDVLFTREAPMGEVGLVEPGRRVCMGQRTMLLRTFPDLIDPRFLLVALRDSAFQRRMIRAAVGSTVKHLRVGDVEALVIPVPPPEEQRRIVAKVEHLMKLCDDLKAKLQRAEDRASKLVEAVVQEMVA
jgi:type I restriction enzyme, S subunit